MSTWKALLDEYTTLAPQYQGEWLLSKLFGALGAIQQNRENRHVLLYGSAFLQKPYVPGASLSITSEDINGLMACLHGMSWERGLTLVMHTPGGQIDATESIVEYLRSKFDDVEVIVPTFAMSAGTMISLATNRVWLGKHSQLGPIDPQMVTMDGRTVSAQAVVDQFEAARAEILKNLDAAHVWAPILPSMGPALLKEAENALSHSQRLVGRWLSTGMLKDDESAQQVGDQIASRFNDAGEHKSHGKRIGFQEASDWGVKVSRLEDSQELQEAVLTAYHLMTLVFEQTPCVKLLATDHGQTWIKNFQTIEERFAAQAAPPPQIVPEDGNPV